MIFVSLFTYTLHKLHGPEGYERAAVAELESGVEAAWPGFRTLFRARKLYDVALHLDGSTYITKARSRAAGEFLRSPCDLWLSIDDDIDAPAEVIAEVIDFANSDGGLVMAPYAKRGHETGKIGDGGMGLSCIGRGSLQAVVDHFPELVFDEEFPPGVHRTNPGLFADGIVDRVWEGEDISFFRRVRAAGVPIRAVETYDVVHAGKRLTPP